MALGRRYQALIDRVRKTQATGDVIYDNVTTGLEGLAVELDHSGHGSDTDSAATYSVQQVCSMRSEESGNWEREGRQRI